MNVTLDGEPLSVHSKYGKVIDNCDGTYHAIVTQVQSGYRTFYVSMGPDDGNLNFVAGEVRGVGGFGANAGFYQVLTYSGPTADADVSFERIDDQTSVGSTGLGSPSGTFRVGETLRATVSPKDAHGNFQVRLGAFPNTGALFAHTRLTLCFYKNRITKPGRKTGCECARRLTGFTRLSSCLPQR